MALRKKLLEIDNKGLGIDKSCSLIYHADPLKISLTDLLFLMRLGRARANNQLGHLQYEAKCWVRENIDKINKRLENEKEGQ